MVAAAAVWWRKREACDGLRSRSVAFVVAPVLLMIVPAPALGAPERGPRPERLWDAYPLAPRASRPLPIPSGHRERAAGRPPTASNDVQLLGFVLLVAAFISTTAVVLVAARNVGAAMDRAFRPRLGPRPLVQRSHEAWDGLARTVPQTVAAARGGARVLAGRIAGRWTDARPFLRRRSWPGTGLGERLADWWAAATPSLRGRLRLGRPGIAVEAARTRTADALIGAFELFGNRAKIGLWVVVAVLAGVGVTFLISQSTQ